MRIDDIWRELKDIFVKSSEKPMLWVHIKIASAAEAILMSAHSIGFFFWRNKQRYP